MFTYENIEPEGDGLPHFFMCKDPDFDMEEVVGWVEERHGKRNLNGKWWCTYTDGFFWFRDQPDAFEFRMRWC